jgi:hypothetical protein
VCLFFLGFAYVKVSITKKYPLMDLHKSILSKSRRFQKEKMSAIVMVDEARSS